MLNGDINDVLRRTPVIVDFETYAIEDGTPHPPQPIGVAIQYPDKPAQYYAFGHITNNNCIFEDAKKALQEAWRYEHGVCFHNLGFDVPIAEHYFDVPRLPVTQYHDTKVLAFLLRPDDSAHGLKELAADMLELPPDEQDAVADWLEVNAKRLGVKVSRAKKSDDYFAKKYHLVPGDLLGRYAEGDTIRTQLLWQKLFPRVWFDEISAARKKQLNTYSETRMLSDDEYDELCILTRREKFYGAYLREIEVSLILAEMRYIGMRINTESLKIDITLVKYELTKIDAWFKEFFQGREVNLSAPEQVIHALLEMGVIQKEHVPKTKKGKMSGSAKALNSLLPNSLFSSLYAYQMKLNKYLGTFMLPWYEQASKNDCIVYTSWVPVKTETDGAAAGTRTGRISSQPNLQNIPRTDKQRFFKDADLPDKPEYPFEGAPILPNIRGYVIPYHADHTFIDVDYSQQELRVLAHFEDDKMLSAFKEDPNLDIHSYTKDMIAEVSNQEISRSSAKMIGFTIVYGGGIPILSDKLETTPEHAATLKFNYFKAFPRIQTLNDKLKKAANRQEPFYTLGGRRYFAIKEKGQYKCHLMLNTLIQGSSADMSKQALIDFYRIKDTRTIIILTVHDEFLISSPLSIAKEEAEKLVYCMEHQYCDAPLIADCVYGKNTWAECKAA